MIYQYKPNKRLNTIKRGTGLPSFSHHTAINEIYANEGQKEHVTTPRCGCHRNKKIAGIFP